VIEVQLPTAQVHTRPGQEPGSSVLRVSYICAHASTEPGKHRGFAFVTFASAEDAADAIDNMDMNELQGRVLKCNLARPTKTPAQVGGNRAGACAAVWDAHRVLMCGAVQCGSLRTGCSSIQSRWRTRIVRVCGLTLLREAYVDPAERLRGHGEEEGAGDEDENMEE
jgi:peptidyl-prolyl isomerase E (cyclophilin E)